MFGKEKSLKSMLAMDLARAVATGESWLGLDTTCTGPIVYLQIELPHEELQDRWLGMAATWHANQQSNNVDAPTCKSCGKKHHDIIFWSEPWIKLDQPSGLTQLDTVLTQVKPTMLIVDPLYRVLSGNLLDPNVARDFADSMDLALDKHNVTLVIVAHSRKGGYDPEQWGTDDLLGPGLFSAWADSTIRINRKGGGDRVVVNFGSPRYAREFLPDVEVLWNEKTMEFQVVHGIIPREDT